MKSFLLNVTENDINIRIDKYIASKFPEKSRSSIDDIIGENAVTVNQKIVNKSYKIKKNDIVSITFPELQSIKILPQNIPLDIIFEDNDILVINKPKNMVVHPAPGNYDSTLVNALLFHCKDTLSGINGKIRPGIVHRIDKDTTGLLVIAKNDFSHIKLAEQIKNHNFLREYEAIVHGILQSDFGTINKAIARNKFDRKKMCVSDSLNAKTAITHYSVIKRYKNFTHIRLKLETGRTHQIRVHMSSIGHPVLGDSLYGSNTKKINFLSSQTFQGQCLHAKSLGIMHPRYEKYMLFESDLPEYFQKIIERLKNV